jgi:hypothetical protein
MSQENVELVRSFTRRTSAAISPGVTSAELGFDPVYVGHDGVRTFWRQWLSAWETTSFEYDEFIDAGEHAVLVQSQRYARPDERDRARVELLRPGLDDSGRQGRAYAVLPHSRPAAR